VTSNLLSSQGVLVRSATSPRSTLGAAAILSAGLLAACGTARTVDGQVPVCERCHGDSSRVVAPYNALARAAPPRSVDGFTAPTDLEVGAHEAHVNRTRLRGPIACDECHVTPADMQAHEAQIAAIAAGTAQRVTFGPLANPIGAGATWDYPAATTCTNTWCHGGPLDQGGTNHTPDWIAGGTPLTCTTCHGFPPDPATTPHPSAASGCSTCHSLTVRADNTIIVDPATGASTHIDGRLTVDATACAGDCACCHAAPPATGAHLAHVTSTPTLYGVDSKTSDSLATTATTFDFGCGNCHPTDPARHQSGAVDLSPTDGTVGSLKALNDPAAAYDPLTGTCSGVYCHSTGQAAPTFVQTPGWGSGTALGCDGCHANPPSYANGGAGAATANSHVGWLLDAGNVLATGHFAGLPATLHEGSAHGGGTGTQFAGDSASPLTCQTCHYVTADPAGTGPSAFYYLNTTGTYRPADDWTGAPATPVVLACAACHTGTPPTGTGGTRTYFHVNGARDVAFDPRTDLAGMDAAYAASSLPATPNTPTRPYWYTRATTNNVSGGDSPVVTGIAGRTDAGFDGTTLSLHLADATWDGATKTCSNVACHYNRTSAQWGEPLSTATCSVCHSN